MTIDRGSSRIVLFLWLTSPQLGKDGQLGMHAVPYYGYVRLA